jgi:hypothetical protein
VRFQILVLANVLQIHQHIARANFTADRGVRFGQDRYDDRMQATKLLEISAEGASIKVVSTVGEHIPVQKTMPRTTTKSTDDNAAAEEEQPANKSKDPIKMFGILVPQALRQAQSQAVLLVEDIVPRLVEINLEMESMEVEIRRKRKYRAKAEKNNMTSEHSPVALESTA